MDNNTYVSGKKVQEVLGVHQQTLYKWDAKGKIETIRTPGGKRLYNLNKYLNDYKAESNKKKDTVKNEIIVENVQEHNTDKLNICYCRVSSVGQKDDLKRQIDYMKEKYPNHEIIQDIGSGLNFKRKGLYKIIKLSIAGQINEVVVAYKDRLARFGYDLIESLIQDYSNGSVIVLNKQKLEPQEELMQDMLQIMNVFVAKMNGMRKYTKQQENT
jgi:predicted site-specific integrase-resolvase